MDEKKSAHVIVIGNEKGGSGKTTTAMHLITALLRLGFSVGSMDIDARQRSLSRYVENRRKTLTKLGINLTLPYHMIVNRSPFNVQEEAEADEKERFSQALQRVFYTADFVVIDSPGSDTYLARLAHSYADTVITPINDSFVDLDVLASIDSDTMEIIRPSIYSQMLWEQKLQRAKRDGGNIDWIVMRNRLSHLDAKNKRYMADAVNQLARRIGFRQAPGLSERVIFRELFLKGLTVLDVLEEETGIPVKMSHITARQEVRDLLKILSLPEVNQRMDEQRRRKEAEEKAEKTASKEKSEEQATPPVAAEGRPAPQAKDADGAAGQTGKEKLPEVAVASETSEKTETEEKKPESTSGAEPQSSVYPKQHPALA